MTSERRPKGEQPTPARDRDAAGHEPVETTNPISEAWRTGRHSHGAGLRERQEAEYQGGLS